MALLLLQLLLTSCGGGSEDAAAEGPPGGGRIPELQLWISQMQSFGKKHCEFLKSPGGDQEQKLAATYYDAERIFYQLGDYTGDKSWFSCAQAAERIYRDNYAVRFEGRVPGYWNFTRGLALDYTKTNDSTSKDTAILLSTAAAFTPDTTPLEWTRDAETSREVAYAILSYLDAEELGQPRRQRLAKLVDQALGHLDQWFGSQTAPYIRPFMVGLTAEALIAYHEKTGDARVVPALIDAMDKLWSKTWIPEKESFRYTDRVVSSGGIEPAPDLNLLIAPAFAWLFKQTGETRFKDRGDRIFAGGVKFAFLGGPKQFNQSYRWSIDYVRWRSAAPKPSP